MGHLDSSPEQKEVKRDQAPDLASLHQGAVEAASLQSSQNSEAGGFRAQLVLDADPVPCTHCFLLLCPICLPQGRGGFFEDGVVLIDL